MECGLRNESVYVTSITGLTDAGHAPGEGITDGHLSGTSGMPRECMKVGHGVRRALFL